MKVQLVVIDTRTGAYYLGEWREVPDEKFNDVVEEMAEMLVNITFFKMEVAKTVTFCGQFVKFSPQKIHIFPGAKIQRDIILKINTDVEGEKNVEK